MFTGCYVGSEGTLGGGSLGRLPQGIYASDSDGRRTYVDSGVDEWSGVTETASYTIYYFEILEDGSRVPASGVSNTGPNALALGQNTPILITGTESTANVVMYRADTFSITTTGGTAIGQIPAIESTVSGGAWSITHQERVYCLHTLMVQQ